VGGRPQVAARLGVALRTVQRWSSGERKPDVFVAQELAQLADVPVAELEPVTAKASK